VARILNEALTMEKEHTGNLSGLFQEIGAQ